MGVVCVLAESRNPVPEMFVRAQRVDGKLVVVRFRSFRGVGEDVLISSLLDFNKQVHQAHVGDVGERIIAEPLLTFVEFHDVTPVLVLDTVKTNVRLDGPKHTRIVDSFGGMAEGEATGFRNLVQIIALE